MFYIIQIVNTTEGVAKAITEQSTLDLAKMEFHQILASAMANENVSEALAMVISSSGAVYANEYYKRSN